MRALFRRGLCLLLLAAWWFVTLNGSLFAEPGRQATDKYPPEIREIFEQSTINRCGPISLQACANFLQVPIGAHDVAKYLPNDGRVTTFSRLTVAAERLGLSAVPVRWDGKPRMLRHAPAILAVEFKGRPHFLAAVGERRGRLLLIDFPDAGWIDLQRLRDEFHWQGEALHIVGSKWSLVGLYALLYWKQAVPGLSVLAGAVVLLRRRRARHARLAAPQSLPASSAVAVLICAVGGGCGPSSDALIRLEPHPLRLELSDGSDGAERERDTVLRVVNESRSDVRIREVNASCGCTELGEPSRKLVRPGECSEIPIRVELPSIGIKESRIDVRVDFGTVQRTLSADVIMRGRRIRAPCVASLPGRVVLRRDADGKAAVTFKVQTYEQAESPRWIREGTVEGTENAIRLLGVDEASSWDAGVVVRSYTYRMEAGQARDVSRESSQASPRITLTSGDRDRPVARIFSQIEDWQPMRFSPRSLYATTGGEDDPLTREVRVIFDDERFRPLKVDAEANESWITVKSVAFDGGREALVTVELQRDKSIRPGAIRGSLNVQALSDNATARGAIPILLR